MHIEELINKKMLYIRSQNFSFKNVPSITLICNDKNVQDVRIQWTHGYIGLIPSFRCTLVFPNLSVVLLLFMWLNGLHTILYKITYIPFPIYQKRKMYFSLLNFECFQLTYLVYQGVISEFH